MSDTTFSIEAFRDFCAGKGDEEFDPCNGQACAGFQFLKAQGEPIDWCGVHHWYDRRTRPNDLPESVGALLAESYAQGPMPFSALASRLDNLIGEGGNG